jgi:hypothetical protein
VRPLQHHCGQKRAERAAGASVTTSPVGEKLLAGRFVKPAKNGCATADRKMSGAWKFESLVPDALS